MTPTTWQEVVVQALNVAQTVLLAYLAARAQSQGKALDEIRRRSYRRRSGDPERNDPAP